MKISPILYCLVPIVLFIWLAFCLKPIKLNNNWFPLGAALTCILLFFTVYENPFLIINNKVNVYVINKADTTDRFENISASDFSVNFKDAYFEIGNINAPGKEGYLMMRFPTDSKVVVQEFNSDSVKIKETEYTAGIMSSTSFIP